VIVTVPVAMVAGAIVVIVTVPVAIVAGVIVVVVPSDFNYALSVLLI